MSIFLGVGGLQILEGCELSSQMSKEVCIQGWYQKFSDGGLKYGFQGTITAKNLRKNSFYFLTGG